MKHPQSNSELQERALLYAIGALPEEERRDYALHLEMDGCAVCITESAGFQNAAQALALDLPAETPSAAVKERLMAEVRSEVQASDSSRGFIRPETPRKRNLLQWTGWGLAAAAAIAVVLLAGANAALRRQIDSLTVRISDLEAQAARSGALLASLTAPEVRVLNLKGQGSESRARARIFWNEADHVWRVYVAGLPQVSVDRSYQLWFVPREGNPVSAQVFNTTPNGAAAFDVQLPPSATELKVAAVTTEPARGLPQPSGAFVLLGGD